MHRFGTPRRTDNVSTPGLILRYGCFAVIATLANLAVQRMVMPLADGQLGYVLALCAGTGSGLVVKYALDKKWIFSDPLLSAGMETRKFSLYTLTGVGTTLVFWGTETAFWLIWQTQALREAGAVIGLAVGYTVKYQLDKRFVFRPGQDRPQGGGLRSPKG